MMLKAFLTEVFSFMSISFTDYKQLLTPDDSLSRGVPKSAELNQHTERAPWCPLFLCALLPVALALLTTPSCSPPEIPVLSAVIVPRQADSQGT